MGDVEYGLSDGMLYFSNGRGITWPGLVAIASELEGFESKAIFFDGVKVTERKSNQGYSGTLNCFFYPEELDDDESRQDIFGLAYTTQKPDSYVIHLVYGVAISSPSLDAKTTGQSLDPSNFMFNIRTSPSLLPGYFQTSSLIIDSSLTYSVTMGLLHDMLYGDDLSEPRLPSIAELIGIFEDNAEFKVIDNGDGTWTATASDAIVHMISLDEFEITSPGATFINQETYKLKTT